MRTPSTLAFVAVTLAAAAVPAAAQRAAADSAAVARTVADFHAALSAGDSAAALRLLAPDLRVLESGNVESLSEYRSHHLAADIAFSRAVPSERQVHAVSVADSVAWIVATSRSTGTYRDRAIDSDGAELMVLSRHGAGWRIRAIHWSSRAHRPGPGEPR